MCFPDIYHQLRVFCVKFSCDASYIISGSDDTNLRLWKAKASEQMGVVCTCTAWFFWFIYYGNLHTLSFLFLDALLGWIFLSFFKYLNPFPPFNCGFGFNTLVKIIKGWDQEVVSFYTQSILVSWVASYWRQTKENFTFLQKNSWTRRMMNC